MHSPLRAPEIKAPLRGRGPRVAIVHYWLIGMRGGERVVERLLHLFPDADLFTHVYDPSAVSNVIRAHKVRTSFIQKLPGALRHYQKYLPLMPSALEELDLRGYDLVISSESGPAKGVIAPPEAQHICYCHSPMRYVWDQYHDYRERAGWMTSWAMPLFFHQLRQWDVSSASRVDSILANSNFVKKRIARTWGRSSQVVHPPVDTDLFHCSSDLDDRYLWVGQMVPYKRPDIAIDAFNRLKLPLLMVGDGEMAQAMKRRAGPNITIVPRLNFDQLRQVYARSRALIFTAQEDFGIVPVEAMASGRPVVAYGSGGALDTVVPHETGILFDEQTADSLIDAIEQLENWLPFFDPGAAVQHSRKFSPESFDAGILRCIDGWKVAERATLS